MSAVSAGKNGFQNAVKKPLKKVLEMLVNFSLRKLTS